MLRCPDLDPEIAGAAYMEFRACDGWLFDDTSGEARHRSSRRLTEARRVPHYGIRPDIRFF
jgi:hypothetical protein